jgi:hypothetical protein
VHGFRSNRTFATHLDQSIENCEHHDWETVGGIPQFSFRTRRKLDIRHASPQSSEVVFIEANQLAQDFGSKMFQIGAGALD